MADDRYEKELWSGGYKYICGCDETGMGSMAGDVYVAAVVFSPGIDFGKLLPSLNDSKKISESMRNKLYTLIKEHALTYATGIATVQEIDEHNIYWARFIAARRAINALSVRPDYILMDGNAKIPEIDIPQTAIVKGDTKSLSIAAASVIAKVERDRYIIELADRVHDDYGWKSNKSYYSQNHIAALKKHGKTRWHRERFLRKFQIGEGNGEI